MFAEVKDLAWKDLRLQAVCNTERETNLIDTINRLRHHWDGQVSKLPTNVTTLVYAGAIFDERTHKLEDEAEDQQSTLRSSR